MMNREILDFNLNEENHEEASESIKIAYKKASQKSFHLSILMILVAIVLIINLLIYLKKCYNNYDAPNLICIASWLFAIAYLFILGLKYKAYKHSIETYLKHKSANNYEKLWQAKLILNRYMLFFWILPLIYIVLLRLFLD